MFKSLAAFVLKNPLAIGVTVLVVVASGAIKGFFSSKDVTPIDVPMNDNGSSLSNSKAKQLADKLHIAMERVGTDEGVIFSILSTVSQSDYAKIFNKFGLRPYNNIWGEEVAPWLNTNRDLSYWLYNELSFSERNELFNNNPNLSFLKS